MINMTGNYFGEKGDCPIASLELAIVAIVYIDPCPPPLQIISYRVSFLISAQWTWEKERWEWVYYIAGQTIDASIYLYPIDSSRTL